jgi:metallo-beta-lactamase class B
LRDKVTPIILAPQSRRKEMRRREKVLAIIGGLALTSAAPAPSPEPFRIAGNLYSVGAGDETAFLITDKAGMILLDSGPPDSAATVLANVARLGFDPREIRFLLNSQAHQDHAGGLAAIKARTGALMLASSGDAIQLERGGRGDFAFGDDLLFEPVKVDRIVRHGEVVRLGEIAITARITPGHTRGCTSWTLPVREGGNILQALFICGASAPGYRLTDNRAYPEIVRDFEASFSAWRRLPCQLFLGAHGSYIGMERKRALLAPGRPNPFVDPGGCRSFLKASEQRIREHVARERTEQSGR